MKDLFKNKQFTKFLPVYFIILSLVILLGTSYALLRTSVTSTNAYTMNVGTLNVQFFGTTDSISIQNMVPMTDEEGLAQTGTGNILNFTIKNTGNIKADYDVYIEETSSSTPSLKPVIRYSVNKGDTEYGEVKSVQDNMLYIDKDQVLDTTEGNNTVNYKVKIWISETADKTYMNITFTAKVVVTSRQHELSGAEKLMAAADAKEDAVPACQNQTRWVDDMGTQNDESDDITYISGSATCIDFNYVWYSGKLWRITAIYPDGAMKLVTENAITAIQWGSDVEYDGSYMYQWLNEDFLDTLYPKVTYNEQSHEYSHPVLKTNAVWNYSTDNSSTPVRPETIATQKTKAATVGLLNAYEYYNSYRCNGTSACTGSTYGSGYLNNSLYWWLITPYSGSDVRYVTNRGGFLNGGSPSGNAYGARPSIILQSNVSFSGSGTKNDPYRLVGVDPSANVGDNLYSRYSGEYVNFNGEKYRIVSIDENNITKLTKFDYIKNGTTVATKNFARSAYFKKDGNTQTDTFWDYYLNNNSEGGWLYSIPTTYKNMMVEGTYYLGWYGSSNVNYKATVCKDSAATLNSTTINNCTKYTSNDADKTFTGKVGLPRVGEMFSAQLKVGTNSYSNMWLITPYSGSSVRSVSNRGNLDVNSPSSSSDGARPSINLSSSVKIACNSTICDGTEEHPYDLSCTNCQSQ